MPIVYESFLVSCIKARKYLANEEEHAVPELETSNQNDESAATRHAAVLLCIEEGTPLLKRNNLNHCFHDCFLLSSCVGDTMK